MQRVSNRFDLVSELLLFSFIPLVLAACGDNGGDEAIDPETAPRAVIDRFSAAAGHLQVRDGQNGLPAANAPIDFDQGPFITTGFTPSGRPTRYYNFDVQPTQPAPIYVPVHGGQPIAGQLNIVGVIPGDPGYSDFWQVVQVEVPDGYVANSLTSVDELIELALPMTPTQNLVNCPLVPEGSTATRRFAGGDASIHRGWYRHQLVHYFSFEEKALGGSTVPTAPIFVTFAINPDQAGGGPPSGFETEPGTSQTHNVIAVTPADPGYSPLWSVQVYDNEAFSTVHDLTTAHAAPLLARDQGPVNCPVVE